ncbi:hypothetical protein FQZ97_842800 [compost metagenome]
MVDVRLVDVNTFLLLPVVVGVELQPVLLPRLQVSLKDGVLGPAGGDPDRSALAAIPIGTTIEVLHFPEERQALLIGPFFQTAFGPVVIVASIASDVDQTIDGG